ncbi:hypothetical protein PIB30_000540 [Stylosanthes scabra]|uniref:Uncharacterized protein n=1 Tax=Stylosanthes scabra TaxID=79078 RepID=A0ABU6W382_9FABA|nr:hypothetical protein [Stylosanthes scabra]
MPLGSSIPLYCRLWFRVVLGSSYRRQGVVWFWSSVGVAAKIVIELLISFLWEINFRLQQGQLFLPENFALFGGLSTNLQGAGDTEDGKLNESLMLEVIAIGGKNMCN